MNRSAAMEVAIQDLPPLDDAGILKAAEQLVLAPTAPPRNCGALIFTLLERVQQLNKHNEVYRKALANVTADPPHSGTETSKAAARSITPIVNEMRANIMATLIRAGDAGCTAQEIEIRTGMTGNSVRPRLVEMETLGWVKRGDETRATRSGRQASVWRITDAGNVAFVAAAHERATNSQTKEKT